MRLDVALRQVGNGWLRCWGQRERVLAAPDAIYDRRGLITSLAWCDLAMPADREASGLARRPAARSGIEDDAGSPDMLPQAPRAASDAFEPLAVLVRKLDFLSRRLPARLSVSAITRRAAAGRTESRFLKVWN
ncbi:MAG: hypothetical protein OXN84_18420, partial [Albidovulum sp.]|nr:hypothetical protein [Albidovulum sp.]